MDNKINPECLGSKLINGEYYDKKSVKFFLQQIPDSKVKTITNDMTKLTIQNTNNNYGQCIII
jgi:hypothetical protein